MRPRGLLRIFTGVGALALAPLLFGAGFWPWTQRLYVSAKYGFDYGIRQRFKNDNLMVNFIFLTNALDGR